MGCILLVLFPFHREKSTDIISLGQMIFFSSFYFHLLDLLSRRGGACHCHHQLLPQSHYSIFKKLQEEKDCCCFDYVAVVHTVTVVKAEQLLEAGRLFPLSFHVYLYGRWLSSKHLIVFSGQKYRLLPPLPLLSYPSQLPYMAYGRTMVVEAVSLGNVCYYNYYVCTSFRLQHQTMCKLSYAQLLSSAGPAGDTLRQYKTSSPSLESMPSLLLLLLLLLQRCQSHPRFSAGC